jgi:hypothetical protein
MGRLSLIVIIRPSIAVMMGVLFWIDPVMVSGAAAQTPARAQFPGLNEIADMADRICGFVATSGSSTNTTVTGKLNVELNGLAKRLAELGITGAGEITKKEYQGVLQQDLASALKNLSECKLVVFQRLAPLVDPTPPPLPPPPRSMGWESTFETKEQGGGSFRGFPACTALVRTPAAVDIGSFFPRDLSPRNVFVRLTARTDHDVRQTGRWVYYVKLQGSAFQCMNFELLSDGVPLEATPSPVRQGAYTNTEASFAAYQSAGTHTLTLKLGCYFQARQFPVSTFQLKTPSGVWRQPSQGDFTVDEPRDLDRPPGSQGPCLWSGR